jgi:microcystin-dependent protein
MSNEFKIKNSVKIGGQIISDVSTGTSPMNINSTTKVTNLNVDRLDDYHANTGTTANTIPVRDGSGKLPGDITGSASYATTAGSATSAGSASSATTATSADKLTTARTIAVSGAVTGSASFDGSANVTIATTLSASGVPVGAIFNFPTTSTPSGYIKCNGASFSSSTYPALASFLGSTTVPDLRGVFIRGLDEGRGLDAGRSNLSYQADALKAHTHWQHGGNELDTDNPSGNHSVRQWDTYADMGTSTPTGSTGSQDEIRVKNVAMPFYIKF